MAWPCAQSQSFSLNSVSVCVCVCPKGEQDGLCWKKHPAYLHLRHLRVSNRVGETDDHRLQQEWMAMTVDTCVSQCMNPYSDIFFMLCPASVCLQVVSVSPSLPGWEFNWSVTGLLRFLTLFPLSQSRPLLLSQLLAVLLGGGGGAVTVEQALHSI